MRNRLVVLDEFCRRKDPIAWYDAVGRLPDLADVHQAVAECEYYRWIRPAGLRRSEGVMDTLYGPTQLGWLVWAKDAKGLVRAAAAERHNPLPRFSVAQRAAGSGPREVWDLAARTPWNYLPPEPPKPRHAPIIPKRDPWKDPPVTLDWKAPR